MREHQSGRRNDEVARLADEIEQLRTALEAAQDEVSRLAEDRARLLRQLTVQARDLQAVTTLYDQAKQGAGGLPDADRMAAASEQEELRVALEEMQVLTEELEVANTSLHESNRVLDERVNERTRELGEKNAALASSELRFRSLVEGMPQLAFRASETGVWTWASPQWQAYTGQDDADSRGWGWLDALDPEDRDRASAAWTEAAATGRFQLEYRICGQADGTCRWFQTRAAPVRDADGTIVEWLGTSTDIHDLRELQESQRVLVAELQHRTRNLMGVVRSVADKTARSSGDLDDFRHRFRDRLEALSRVQGLLSRLTEHDRVTFDDLIETELSALRGDRDRVVLDGPAGVRLRSSTVQTLAMAIHELATNAVKYGALGQPRSSLTVGWTHEPVGEGGLPWLHIDWRERGVVMPASGAEPLGTGQGRELIEKALPYQLSARTTYVLGPDGVHCTISVPVSASTGGGAGGHG
ncbi:sensor histidine kinase [Sphingomonas corticis]|jgi:PAS domain S-box-containing protein|uniref:histidine kinase n=1 Tax=Sphingomonas corticis TaxID=2722791 RepID=A0ABX1CU86_9SPHN|nr:HWE histidine kinase domain-containing protein [Sphingomonas corticis]NJR80381.1 PAS domain-containing protein [Sphingomonas corticis]